ncbi:MAG: hypothetical protein QGG40_19790, partial [Myxococcota bacterium]|nr:hypothetical protein [Myxococcota bacterium]
GTLFRVVELESPAFEELYALVMYTDETFTETLYDEGPLVAVSGMPSFDVKATWDTAPSSYFTAELGLVEVQPVLPGWSVQGHGTTGPADAGGPGGALALAEAIRFAAGQTRTVDGLTVAQVAQRKVCNEKVLLLGTSGGGITALMTLSLHGEDVAPLLVGLSLFEVPTVPQFSTGALGTVWMDADVDGDADGNGYLWDDSRLTSYVPGSCDALACEADYSTIDWDESSEIGDLYPEFFKTLEQPGMLYLDRDGVEGLTLSELGLTDGDFNGAVDEYEDFPIIAHQDTYTDAETPRMFYAPAVLEAAIEYGAMDPEAWPEQLATLEESENFWATRNAMVHLDDVAAKMEPDFRMNVVFTEVDHAQAQSSRPHLVQLHDGLAERGMTVRYNVDELTARCGLDNTALEDFAGGPAAGTIVVEGELAPYAFPDDFRRPFTRAVGAIGLYWDLLGPFDYCPQLLPGMTTR